MDSKPPNSPAAKDAEARAARLKAALKANLARRKAQARARGAQSGGAGPDGAEQKKEG
jgi:hypothetical protein